MVESTADKVQNLIASLPFRSHFLISLRDNTFETLPNRPIPFQIFEEMMYLINRLLLAENPAYRAALADYTALVLSVTDPRLGIEDRYRHKPGVGWSAFDLLDGFLDENKKWVCRREPVADITYSSIIALALAISMLAQKGTGPANDEAKLEIMALVCSVAEYFFDDFVPYSAGGLMQQPWTPLHEPINHTAIYGLLLLLCHEITGQERYLQKAGDLASAIRAGFCRNPQAGLYFPYRLPKETKETVVGERYWKSTWTALFMMLARRKGLFFSPENLNGVIDSIRLHLLAGGIIHESLSAKDGRALTEAVVRYHMEKGQGESLKRLAMFRYLDAESPGLAREIVAAMKRNSFFSQAIEQAKQGPEDLLLSFLDEDPRKLALSFPFVGKGGGAA